MQTARGLPAKIPVGFVKVTGIPNTSQSKSYFADGATAVARCAADPLCMGVSGQRLFYGDVGTPAIVRGRSGEEVSYIRADVKN